MRKIFATILSLFTLTAASVLPAAGSIAREKAPILASAETQTTVKCTAVADGYAALSSGQTVYVFNESDGVWQEYVHTQTVTQLDFDDAGNLYFLDEQTSLYKLSANRLEDSSVAENTGILCNTFTVEGNVLYHSRQSWIYLVSLDDLSVEEKLFDARISTPGLAFWEGKLYYMYGHNYLWVLNLATMQTSEVGRLTENTTDVTIANGALFGGTNDGTFYGYFLNELSSPTRTPIVEKSGEYFGLSAHNNSVYIVNGNTPYEIVEGQLLPATGAFARPTVKSIPTDALKTEVETGVASPSIVQTKESALLIEVDFQSTTDTFSHKAATRSETPLTALKIAENASFVLLSRFDGEEYKTYVTDKRNVNSPEGEYLFDYQADKEGYVTSEVSLYKYPHLELPALSTLSRGEKITLVGEVKGLEREYYKVRYGEGFGYLPKAYVTDSPYLTQESETIAIGDKEAGKDGTWRLAYILLGGAAICILVDFLILRKKPED